MFRFIGFSVILFLTVMACSQRDKGQLPDIDFPYELMKMEKQGAVDSLIMDLAFSYGDENLIKNAAKTCGIIRDDGFVDRIAELCKKSDKEIRETAIFALGEIKDTTVLGFLEGVLHIEDRDSRIRAIEALGKIGDKSGAPFVRPLLKKSDLESCEAAFALWRMGDSSSIEHLKLIAENSRMNSLYGTIYAMFRLSPDSCVPEFVRVFENRPPDDSVYIETSAIAARGLGAAGDTAAVLDIYNNYFESLERPSKIEMIRSMGITGVGRDGLEKLLENTNDDGIKRVVLLSLGRMGDIKSRKTVEKYLYDKSLQVQLAAISVLPEVNKRSPTNTLIKLKSNAKWQVRAEVARSLGKVKSRRSLGQLRLMLEDNDDRVKAAVIEGLGEFPVRRNIDIIRAALNGSRDPAVKSIAADVLGSSGDSKALEILIEAAENNAGTEDIDFARSLVAAIGQYVDTTAGGIAAANTLKGFLGHHNRIVREDAYKALGNFAPDNFDPGIFEVDFSEEDFDILQSLTELDIIAIIEMERGTITLKLESKIAPRTSANFVRLAERGFYDGLTFHRVVQNFVVQGGCPRGDGWGGPGYMICEEINSIKFERGTIGMATSGRNTGGSQFFICLLEQPHLDGRYTAFGNIIEGWDVLDKIEIGDKILSIKIEKGRF